MKTAQQISEEFNIPLEDVQKAIKFSKENGTDVYETLRGMGYLDVKEKK